MLNLKPKDWPCLPWQVAFCAALQHLMVVMALGLVGLSATNAVGQQGSTLAPRRRAGISSSSVGSPPAGGSATPAPIATSGDTLPWKAPGSATVPTAPTGFGASPGVAPPANPNVLPWRGSAPAAPWSGSAATPAPVPNAPYGFSVGAPASGPALKVTKGNGSLPNEAGQVWREYDISPYTSKLRSKPKAEQAIVDWIIRETGQDIWFSQPLGILNADANTLRVYHTPEVQTIVHNIVERFVRGQAEGQAFGVRILTIGSPNWRTRAFALMRPVEVQSSGVEAWLLSRENTTVLMNDLRRRTDYREVNTPNLTLVSGLTETVTRTRTRSFTRSIRSTLTWPGYEGVPAQLDEGFGLQISPLLSLDGTVCEAAIKCNIDQLEKLVPLTIDVTTPTGVQRAQIQVPQLVSWRMNERFRWPTDQVLLLSCGIVANPGGENTGAFAAINPFDGPGSRADALMLIQYLGRADQQFAGPAPLAANNPGGTMGPSPFSQPAPSLAPMSPISNPYVSGTLPPPSSFNRGRY